jgi:hypothetical protein
MGQHFTVAALGRNWGVHPIPRPEARQYAKLQLRMVKELMEGKGIKRPSNVAAVDETFKKAPKAKSKGQEQTEML